MVPEPRIQVPHWILYLYSREYISSFVNLLEKLEDLKSRPRSGLAINYDHQHINSHVSRLMTF